MWKQILNKENMLRTGIVLVTLYAGFGFWIMAAAKLAQIYLLA